MSQEHIRLDALTIKEAFQLQAQRAEGLRALITSMIQVETVNLKKMSVIAQAKNGVLPLSIERRFSRLISEIELCPIQLALFIVQILGLKIDKHNKRILILDRTYWPYGDTHINILYLAIEHNGVAIPIFFKLLGEGTENGKKGNSSIAEREELLKNFTEAFGIDSIEALMGDREFMGKDWIDQLKSHPIPHVMRVKASGIKIQNAKGNWVMLDDYCKTLEHDIVHDLGFRTLGATKSFTTNLMVLVKTTTLEDAERQSKASRGSKNNKNQANKKALKNGETTKLEPEIIALCYSTGLHDVCELYRIRWTIETLFFAFKSGGFHIEDTHITDPKRLIFLMQAAMIAMAVCVKTGELSQEVRPILVKKHGRKSESVMKRGMRNIQTFLSRYDRCQKTPISTRRVLRLVKPWRQNNRVALSYKPPDLTRIDAAA